MAKRPYSPPTINRTTNGYLDKHVAAPVDHSADCIDGARIEELVREHGSPLFVYSENKLREKYREAQRAFSTRYPKVQFAWSYKTNYLKAICNVFHEEGAIAEVVSDFEYDKARNLGMRGDQIIVNGPYKTEAFLQRAVSEGAKVQIDNHQEITLLERVAQTKGRKVDVAIRVSMETGCEPAWSKFGFSYEMGEASLALKRVCESPHLNLVGLHSHIGTFILDPAQYQVSMNKMISLVWAARHEYGIEIEYLNAGGGFASCNTLHGQYLPGKESTPSFQKYAEAICNTLHQDLPADMPRPMLYLETGRALVDEAGFLITTVMSARRLGDGRQAIVVDAGVNLLYTATWYRFDIRTATPSQAPVGSTTVYGPLCMNIDVIQNEALLPPLSPDDRLVIHPVGAYNITQSMQFITYRPAVIMIGCDGEVHVIREREDLAYVEALEHLPESARKKTPRVMAVR
jgi:diaminopimelate decarboxylase